MTLNNETHDDDDFIYYDAKKRRRLTRPEIDFAADWTYDDYLDMYEHGMRMLL